MISSEQAAALREQLTEQRDAGIRDQIAAVLGAGDVQVLAKRGEAIALQQQASKLLDEADLLELQYDCRAQIDELSGALAAATNAIPGLEDRLAAARRSEKTALARARKADAVVDQAVADERLGQEQQVDPETLVDLGVRLSTARTVASRERAAASQAASVRASAQASLEAGQRAVERGRQGLEAARERLDHAAETARPSETTLLLDLVWRISDKEHLQPAELAVVAALVGNFAEVLGVADQVRHEMRAQVDEERKQELQERLRPRYIQPPTPPPTLSGL